MAGTSDIYTSQISQLLDDLQKWQVFIDQISSVIETFDESMTAIQTQIDSMQTTLNALLIRTDNLEASVGDLIPYVRTSTSAVIIDAASLNKSKKVDIFTNKSTIYVYADKTPDYVTFNNTDVKSMGDTSIYFTSFDGDKAGVQKTIQVTSNNVTSTLFNLWFSYSNKFDESESTKVSVNIQKNYSGKNYLLSDNKVSTSIQSAIDSGINMAESSNKVYINSTLSVLKDDAIQSAAAIANRPTSITNIMTSSNISASAIKTASQTSTTSTTTASEANLINSVVRSSGSSKSLKSSTKTTTSKKLR